MKIKTAGGNNLVVQRLTPLGTICFDVCKDGYEDSFHLDIEGIVLLNKHLTEIVAASTQVEVDKFPKYSISALIDSLQTMEKNCGMQEYDSIHKDEVFDLLFYIKTLSHDNQALRLSDFDLNNPAELNSEDNIELKQETESLKEEIQGLMDTCDNLNEENEKLHNYYGRAIKIEQDLNSILQLIPMEGRVSSDVPNAIAFIKETIIENRAAGVYEVQFPGTNMSVYGRWCKSDRVFYLFGDTKGYESGYFVFISHKPILGYYPPQSVF